jgi:hypothetical protein
MPGTAGVGVNGIANPGINGAPGLSFGGGGQSGQALACKTVSPDGRSCLEPYYSIEAVYFNAKFFSSAAERRLPLDLCR